MPPKRASTIFQIAEQGDHNAMKQVLSKDKSCVNERNEAKETPLHVVCRHCYFLCVEILLKFGAFPNAQDREGLTPLHIALAYGTSQMLPMLLSNGANPMLTDNLSRNALHVATSQAMPKVVEILLMDNPFPEEEEPCPCCWQKAAVDLDGPIHRHHHPRKESRRVAPNHVALVKQEDHKGNTPLHYATSDPTCSAVALQFLDALKEHSTEVVYKPVINAKNKAGYVAIQYAAYTGMAEVVEDLIELGANALVTTKSGDTILHMACEAGDLDTTNTILNVLGDKMKESGGWKEYLNAKDKDGCTAMHHACLNGHLSCVRTMLRHLDDLELEAEDGQGFTPLMIARIMGYPQVSSLLESNGADKKKAKAAIKAKPEGTQLLQARWEDRSAATMIGPNGKPMKRSDPKGDLAISRKSYLLYWAVLVAVVACFAHYAYYAFNEYLSNYDTEEYKRQAKVAAEWTITHTRIAAQHVNEWFWIAVAYVQNWYAGVPKE